MQNILDENKSIQEKYIHTSIAETYRQLSILRDGEEKDKVLKMSEWNYHITNNTVGWNSVRIIRVFYDAINRFNKTENVNILKKELNVIGTRLREYSNIGKVYNDDFSKRYNIKTMQNNIELIKDYLEEPSIIKNINKFENILNSAEDENKENINAIMSIITLSNYYSDSIFKSNQNFKDELELNLFKILIKFIEFQSFDIAIEDEEEIDIESDINLRELKSDLIKSETDKIEFKSTYKTPTGDISSDKKKQIEDLKKRKLALSKQSEQKYKKEIQNIDKEINEIKNPPHLEFETMKNICGFINKGQGGRLYIGITDDDEILGLELDFNRLRKRNKNGLKGDKDLLNAEISQDIQKYFSDYADYVFSQLSMEPIYIKKNFDRNDTGKDLEVLKITINPKPKVTKLTYVKDPNRNNESFHYMKTNHGSKSMDGISVSDWYVNNNAN
tara:strand:- start:753 stop:2087 length:1335 start_codon:yes stop_codon:yes gene_type:complete